MQILLTGITGQVGAALRPPLESAGSLVAADRNRLDLARPDRVASVLDDIAPDLIVNPAAYTAVNRAEDERDLAFRVNAEAPGAMARWAASRGVPLIHFSTDYVFDGGGARPWREDDATGPLSTSGARKLAGEDAIRAAGGPHLVIRTPWVYAATGTNFLRTIARLARERDELGIVSDQIGAPTSAWLIADAVATIVDNPPRSSSASAPRAGSSTWRRRAKRAGTALPLRLSKASRRVTSPCACRRCGPFARRTIRPRRGGLRTPGSTLRDCAKCSASQRRTGAMRSSASSIHLRPRS
jgi:dTDP-4-dehydrorhamnose reductase